MQQRLPVRRDVRDVALVLARVEADHDRAQSVRTGRDRRQMDGPQGETKRRAHCAVVFACGACGVGGAMRADEAVEVEGEREGGEGEGECDGGRNVLPLSFFSPSLFLLPFDLYSSLYSRLHTQRLRLIL